MESLIGNNIINNLRRHTGKEIHREIVGEDHVDGIYYYDDNTGGNNGDDVYYLNDGFGVYDDYYVHYVEEFEPNTAVDMMHKMPRLGHVDNIVYATSSNKEETTEYYYGVISMSFFILLIFFVWSSVLLLLKILGPERFGFSSGHVYKLTNVKIEQEWYQKRYSRIRWYFLISGLIVLTASGCMAYFGLMPLNTTYLKMKSNTELLQTKLSKNKLRVDYLFYGAESLVNNYESAYSNMVDMKKSCPALASALEQDTKNNIDPKGNTSVAAALTHNSYSHRRKLQNEPRGRERDTVSPSGDEELLLDASTEDVNEFDSGTSSATSTFTSTSMPTDEMVLIDTGFTSAPDSTATAIPTQSELMLNGTDNDIDESEPEKYEAGTSSFTIAPTERYSTAPSKPDSLTFSLTSAPYSFATAIPTPSESILNGNDNDTDESEPEKYEAGTSSFTIAPTERYSTAPSKPDILTFSLTSAPHSFATAIPTQSESILNSTDNDIDESEPEKYEAATSSFTIAPTERYSTAPSKPDSLTFSLTSAPDSYPTATPTQSESILNSTDNDINESESYTIPPSKPSSFSLTSAPSSFATATPTQTESILNSTDNVIDESERERYTISPSELGSFSFIGASNSPTATPLTDNATPQPNRLKINITNEPIGNFTSNDLQDEDTIPPIMTIPPAVVEGMEEFVEFFKKTSKSLGLYVEETNDYSNTFDSYLEAYEVATTTTANVQTSMESVSMWYMYSLAFVGTVCFLTLIFMLRIMCARSNKDSYLDSDSSDDDVSENTVSKADSSSSWVCFQSYVLIPLFCICIFLLLFFSCGFAIAVVLNADICSGSPENNIMAIAERFDLKELQPTTYELLEYYVKGCTTNNIALYYMNKDEPSPFTFLNEILLTVKDTEEFVNSFEAYTKFNEEISTTLCPNANIWDNYLSLNSSVSELEILLKSTNDEAELLKKSTSCNIYIPLYIQYIQDVCTNASTGLMVLFFAALCITFFAMIMLTLRVALLQDPRKDPFPVECNDDEEVVPILGNNNDTSQSFNNIDTSQRFNINDNRQGSNINLIFDVNSNSISSNPPSSAIQITTNGCGIKIQTNQMLQN